MVVAGKITKQKLTLVFLPIQIKNYQPQLLEGEERLTIINKLKKSLGFDISQDNYGYDTIEIER